MDPHATPDGESALADDLLADFSRFSGWVAHEVNNPVAGIQNAFALLRPLIPVDHPHARFADAIEREIARVAALTQRLHKVYGYDDRRGQPIPFASCIADAVRLLDALSRARDAVFVLDVDRAAGSVMINRRLEVAVVRHLLQHAVESAPAGQIHVRAWHGANQVWLAVPEHEHRNSPGPRPAAGPPGLALEFVRRLMAPLGGDLVMTAYRHGVREISIGLPITAQPKAAT